MGVGPQRLALDDDWVHAFSKRLGVILLVVNPTITTFFWLMGVGRLRIFMVVVSAVGEAILAFAFFSPSISAKTRSIVSIVVLYVFVLAGWLSAGPMAGPSLVAAITTVLAGILLGRRGVVYCSAALAMALAFVMWAIISGWLPEIKPALPDENFQTWLRVGIVTIITIGTLGYVVLFVVERLEASRSNIKKLYLEALEALEARGAFLAMAAHEFRTPVAALSLSVEALSRASKQADAISLDDQVNRVERQAKHLKHLLDAMFDVSRLEHSQFSLRKERCDLIDAIRTAMESVEEQMTQKGCPLEAELAPSIVGDWDAHRIEQLLANLLSNAARHGSGRPVEISAAANEHKASVYVRDKGPGIPEGHLGDVFQPYFQSPETKVAGGMGLGLFIARRIAELHGGKLKAENHPEGGALFTLILPRDSCHTPQRPDLESA